MPAYAASIHKSQGSEYPAVVIPVMTQHYAMLQRNSPAASGLSFWLGRRRPSPSRCATSRAGGVGRSWGMAERGRLEALRECIMSGVHASTIAVAALFGERESAKRSTVGMAVPMVSFQTRIFPNAQPLSPICGRRAKSVQTDRGVLRARAVRDGREDQRPL